MKSEYKFSYIIKDEVIVVEFDVNEDDLSHLAARAYRNKGQSARDGAVTARIVSRGPKNND